MFRLLLIILVMIRVIFFVTGTLSMGNLHGLVSELFEKQGAVARGYRSLESLGCLRMFQSVSKRLGRCVAQGRVLADGFQQFDRV